MNASAQTTVGEIAANYPGSIRVFQQYGIDFCCGGKKPLQQVCLDHGIDSEQMLSDLRDAAQPAAADQRDWNNEPIPALLNHIVTRHHDYLKRELPRLEMMAARVREVHGEKYPESIPALERVFLKLKAELDSHLMKEEMVLFPLIHEMQAAREARAGMPSSHCGSVANPIRVMEFEHDSAGHALVEMRELTGGWAPPADACNTFRGLYHGLEELEADLHRHIHLENNILHPRATRLEAELHCGAKS